MPLEMIHFIIDAGADFRALDKNGDTPLRCAIRSCDIEKVKLLIRLYGSFDEVDNNGNTPLHIVEDESMMKQMIKSNIQPLDFKNKDGATPFIVQMKARRWNLATTLLRHGASHKKENGHFFSLHYLTVQGPQTPPVITTCTGLKDPTTKPDPKGALDLAKTLIRLNVPIDEKDSGGKTPLHEALENGNYEMVDLLTSMGAQTQICDVAGNNALVVAATNVNPIKPNAHELDALFSVIKLHVTHTGSVVDKTKEDTTTLCRNSEDDDKLEEWSFFQLPVKKTLQTSRQSQVGL